MLFVTLTNNFSYKLLEQRKIKWYNVYTLTREKKREQRSKNNYNFQLFSALARNEVKNGSIYNNICTIAYNIGFNFFFNIST